MFFDSNQLVVSILVIFATASLASAIVLQRGRERARVRRWGYALLCVCAITAMALWFRFGDFQTIFVDANSAEVGPRRQKIERHLPFHFHEFFHYYVGAKYFRELGYEALYDCTTLADAEIAGDDRVLPRINGFVRDLDDVLLDKTREQAMAQCQRGGRARMSDARWATFKGDLRQLHRLVPDEWWNSVVYDAGFNPPPSWVLVGSAVANTIPIRLGAAPTYLLATSLDMLLLLACFLALRRAFGRSTAVMAAIFFGATFIASYGWNGGAFLRFTWITSVVLGLCALKRGRWVLAGALFAAATCDRIFPFGFAVGAMVPYVLRSLRSEADRRIVLRVGAGFGATAVVLALASLAVFGVSAWQVFFSRILRHGDIYYTMHIGLKKVLTFRDWVPNQNFQGHDGLANFRLWNIRLRETWAAVRLPAIVLQLVVTAGAIFAAMRRRPHEGGVLFGVCFMFLFNIPANYYYAILALVPAFLLRAAASAPTTARRYGDYIALTTFIGFWLCTLIAPRLSNDVLVYNHFICVALSVFLAVWIVAWLATGRRDQKRGSLRSLSA